MNMRALVLEACLMCGIVDWMEFHALPSAIQSAWLEHAANKASGAYFKKADAPKGDAAAFAARAIAAAKQRGVL